MTINIYKGDKYYSLKLVRVSPAPKRSYLWLSTKEGEGMEINIESMEKLYDAIDKFFQENM